MAHGIVKSFDRAGGHGYIVSDDGETLWVHRGSITGPGLPLEPGQRVGFDRQLGGMGAQAVEVRAEDPEIERRLEFRCSGCGYGIVAVDPPVDGCPMCRTEGWIATGNPTAADRKKPRRMGAVLRVLGGAETASRRRQ
jgi:cold shock CspA family protein